MDEILSAKNFSPKGGYFSIEDCRIKKRKSVLISRHSKREKFFAGQNNLYFDYSKKNLRIAELGKERNFFDSLTFGVVENYERLRKSENDYLLNKYRRIAGRINARKKKMLDDSVGFLDKFSPIQLWNASMLAAVLIGMVSMSLIYRYFGERTLAEDVIVSQNVAGVEVSVKDEFVGNEKKDNLEIAKEKVSVGEGNPKETSAELRKKIKRMVKGYPIEKMLPYIFKQDDKTASYLIAIAKKESNWGRRVPVLKGQDCYNYWGYRQKRKRMGSGGHTCFNSRRDAVDTVGKRMHTLIFDYQKNTPSKMIVWKCGNSCSTHSKKSVRKWISDVDLYLRKLK